MNGEQKKTLKKHYKKHKSSSTINITVKNAHRFLLMTWGTRWTERML